MSKRTELTLATVVFFGVLSAPFIGLWLAGVMGALFGVFITASTAMSVLQ